MTRHGVTRLRGATDSPADSTEWAVRWTLDHPARPTSQMEFDNRAEAEAWHAELAVDGRDPVLLRRTVSPWAPPPEQADLFSESA